MTKDANNLIWIDLEMTGLNPDEDRIIEIATLITDSNLEVLAEGPVLAIHQSSLMLDGMDEWNTKTHGESGLIQKVKASKISESLAEKETIAFLEQYVPAGKSPMCGNSICQDRRFLFRSMPKLERYFHYRNLDVSTVKELARRWKPKVYHKFDKENAHTAMADIKESIAELAYYRENFFRLE